MDSRAAAEGAEDLGAGKLSFKKESLAKKISVKRKTEVNSDFSF